MKILKISSDDFLCYFAWHGLNENFRKEIVHITNVTHPSLKEITDNYFTACVRYENENKFKRPLWPKSSSFGTKQSIENKSVSMAVKVNSNSNKGLSCCPICSYVDQVEANHSVYKCPKFPTAREKFDKLKELHGCTKCASLVHKSQDCTFKFKYKCSNCSGWHFSFLCN